MIARGRTRDLAEECKDHERGIDPIATGRLNGVDGSSIRNLRDLHARVESESLNNRPSNRESSDIGTDAHASQIDQQADIDRKRRHEFADKKIGIDRPEKHGCYANEGEEADDQGAVVVWWAG